MYTTNDLSELFNVSTETVRQWAKDFKSHLKPPANPAPNRARQFDDDDMQIMTLVAELKARRLRDDEIITAILNGERRPIPNQALQIGGAERGQIARLKDQVNTLQLSLSETIAASNQKDGKIELLKQQNAELEKEIRQLIGELAVMKSRG